VFVLLLGPIDGREDVVRVAESVLSRMGAAGASSPMTSSIGASVFPEDGRDRETLFRSADRAMRNAKESGGRQLQFDRPFLTAHLEERVAVERALRDALHNGQFRVEFLPVVPLDGGPRQESEALLLWRHPTMGTLRPERFIPLAEESGLIVPIGEWVLQEACRRAAMAGVPRVAVNLSARQLASPRLLPFIRRVLRENQLAGNRLCVEINDATLMSDVDGVIDTLAALQNLGVRIALDDFGSGYLSMHVLRRLRPDVIKIDRQFIQSLPADTRDAAIVRAILAMGRSLNVDVLAEGVETYEQEAFLIREGCRFAQGFLYSPVSTPAPVSGARLPPALVRDALPSPAA
jgi:EAL domain-containing protein (putative c-di-GMP-specific phosphodiesterase class I)